MSEDMYILRSITEHVETKAVAVHTPDIDYKYNEGKLLDEVRANIDGTYGEHYAKNKLQATEFVIDSGHGVGFTIGNIIKYAQRYGHKGGRNRADLLKIIHYTIMALFIHDKETT